MPLPLQKFREIVLQLLYSSDLSPQIEGDTLAFLSHEQAVSARSIKEAKERMSLIMQMRDELDGIIAEISQAYALDRIQRIERNVLRLGVFELLYDPEIPPKVAISEAMRLARKYSTPEAGAFVNALLDGIYKKKATNA